MFKLNARIEVFPANRSAIKTPKSNRDPKQIIIAKVSNDLYRYYQTLLFKEYGVILDPPTFGAHITINDARKPIEVTDKVLKLNNKQISVECDPNIYLCWEFFAVRVYSKELDTIRASLGLSENFPFHITIGKISDKSKVTSTSLVHRFIKE